MTPEPAPVPHEVRLAWALRVQRAGLVRMALDDFSDLDPETQEALALAGDILAGRCAHPDAVGPMLAAGFGAS